ncbi:hypothetical protein [Fluviispira multicolorata]|uniref:Long-chain fatty acid transport protein n=1 Tax=Fluviispira multicolorata TaxID=2654512 RepID=A0A833N5L9_9BACT|nr:hypothetical protein [Fluviispira multicolorata]KAB8030907.1 hypothetical protein GCL57_08010 [Fluviispira multicolorata]
MKKNFIFNKKKFVLFLILLNYNFICRANITIPPLDLYLDPHALGMGGAFVGLANDENSIFSNPAGIGFFEKRENSKSILKFASFPNITAAANSYSAGLLDYYFNSNTKYPTKELENSIENANPTDIVYSRASLFPTVVISHFQFGFLADTLVTGYTTKYAAPKTSAFSTQSNPITYDRIFSLVSRTQAGPCFGVGIPLPSSNVSFGVGARYLERASIISTIEGNQNGFVKESSDDTSNKINRTQGVAIDIGILIPFRSVLNFKIGASALDIGNTTFQPSDNNSTKEIEVMNLKTGMSINPSIGKDVGFLMSVEAERINDQRVNDRDKLRVGSELSFGSFNNSDAFISLRAGYSMRTVSAGLTLSTLFARLEFATFGEAVQTNDGVVADRRYAFRLTVDLNK